MQGGSTITQQFVKNTYIEPERTISRKLKEAALAWQLERRWSKDRILTAYLNTIYFGNGAYGIEMAARVYFEKHASDLTLAEAALLAGIPAEPGDLRPDRQPDPGAGQRRDTVLALMFGQGLITRRSSTQRSEAPLPSPDQVHLPGHAGPCAVLRRVREEPADPVLRVRQGLRRRPQGLHVDRPRAPEARPRRDRQVAHRPGRASRLRSSRSIRETAEVLAMIGGTSFSKSQFNLAVQGERQPGSSFKPFVLATALTQGISPETTFVSKPQVISLGDKLWAVTTTRTRTSGQTTSRTRRSSRTTPSTRSSRRNSVRRTSSDMAHRLGIQSPLDGFLAIGLGVEAVNPLEMARAFSTFANGGSRVDGSLLGNLSRARCSPSDGKRLDRNEPVKRPVLDAERGRDHQLDPPGGRAAGNGSPGATRRPPGRRQDRHHRELR